jgi:thiol-disulfide isomerase/thioredoxin
LVEKLKYYAKEILYFIIFITIATNLISLYKSSDLNKAPLSLKNITLIDKTNFTPKDDKAIIVHFWATWCPTCKLEASNIQTLSENFEVVTIAVKSGSDKEIKKWLKDRDYTFKVINDYDGRLSSEFNIAAFPTTFIYNKNKEALFSEVGYTSTFGIWLRMLFAKID